MRLSFLKIQFCRIQDLYTDFNYKLYDYIQTIRFRRYGLDYSDQDFNVWLTHFSDVMRDFKKDHPIKNFIFTSVIWIVDFPGDIPRYWLNFRRFVKPESYIVIDGKSTKVNSQRYIDSCFQTTAMYVLFEKFRLVFEDTWNVIKNDDFTEYDIKSQNIYIKQLELYHWWMKRRSLDTNTISLEEQEELEKTERKNVRELLEISSWI